MSEAAASLKGRFLRSSASAQDLLAAKEPAQLDDISHGQESLVALSGDSPSSDAEAAASLKGRFLRSSASAQDLLAAKEPAQLDDISHGQESLVAAPDAGYSYSYTLAPTLAPVAAPDAGYSYCKSTAGLGRPDQTLRFSSSVTSKSILLIFGRVDCSHRVLEAQPMCSCQNVR